VSEEKASACIWFCGFGRKRLEMIKKIREITKKAPALSELILQSVNSSTALILPLKFSRAHKP
jgi:hypothetical protein